jgi:hypothetical protein
MSLPPPLPAPSTPPPPPAFQEVPVGVARSTTPIVIGILFLVGAAVELLGVFTPLDGSVVMRTLNVIDSIVFCALLTFAGVGLLLYKRWAPTTAIVAMALRFLVSLPLTYQLLRDDTASGYSEEFRLVLFIAGAVLIFVYFLVLTIFLCLKNTRAACVK